MILVTLGTNDKQFTRLLDAVENACKNGLIQDEVIVQSGFTKYESKYMKVFPYLDRNEFTKYIQTADLVICHGGVGTIMTALNAKRKILAAARLEKYGEHVNDHQIQLLEAFEERGFLVYMKDLDQIGTYLNQIKTFQPKSYESNTDHMVSLIETWIEEHV